MLNQRYKPTLRDLVRVDALPDNLGFLEQALGTILDKLYYHNLRVFRSMEGHSASYTLDVELSDQLTILSVPGVDFSLILNPPDILGNQSGSTFNISLEYHWEILKYINGVDLSTFGFDIRSYLNLLSQIFNIPTQDMIAEAINVFIGDLDNPPGGQDPLQDFVNAYNTKYDPNITSYTDLGDVINQIQAQHDIFEIIISDYLQDAFDRLRLLIAKWVGPLDEDRLKDLLLPKVSASLNNVNLGIAIPRSVLIPLHPTSGERQPEPEQTILRVNGGSFLYNTESGLLFEKDIFFDFPHSEVLETGFTLAVHGLQVDLSSVNNIPAASHLPSDFKGIYFLDATLTFPSFWKYDTVASTGVLKASNVLAGNKGFTGVIQMMAITQGDPAPVICAKFGQDFAVCLTAFQIEFQQNAILSSTIQGNMKIPGFKDATGADALINIDVFIGQNGEFSVTASEDQGITAIEVPDVFSIRIDSLSLGRKEGRFFVKIAGALQFEDMGGAIGQFIPDEIGIPGLTIYDNGQIALDAGRISFTEPITLKIAGVGLSLSAFGMGSYERQYDGNQRQYRCFSFDGGVGTGKGGLDVSGRVGFYYTIDNDVYGDSHVFIRIPQIAIDIIQPGGASPANADLIIKGFLSVKSPEGGGGGNEYTGGVSLKINKLKLEASAAMRLFPSIPAFLIDILVKLPSGIPLGSTGASLYGLRGTFGVGYVTKKSAAGVAESDPWWMYYKAAIPLQYQEGIVVEKFLLEKGGALGAGVGLGTGYDGGFTAWGKLFALMSFPNVFLLQGQGAFLKPMDYLSTTDPPFFFLIAISSTSLEMAFGVDYKLPDEGNKPGSIATVTGICEIGFFWSDPAAFYFNIGKEFPDSRRIQVRLLNLFNAYFYFMATINAIRAGAGASLDIQKKFGPLRAVLKAYLDVSGRISRIPKQIGGSIQMGAEVGLYIWKFGFSMSLHASLVFESSKSFIITGALEACVRVLRKNRCAKFEFTWVFDNSLDLQEIKLLKPDLQESAKAIHMNTFESFELWASSNMPTRSDLENYIIPPDCTINIEFVKSVLPSAQVRSIFGGHTQGSHHIEYVAPQRGKSDRVRHEYELESVEILYHNGSSWIAYDVYEAATPLSLGPFASTDSSNFKHGYWQYQSPNQHTKLTVLAQSPLHFTAQGADTVIIEEMGITTESIFCDPTPIEKTCVRFDSFQPGHGVNENQEPIVPANNVFFHEQFTLQILGADGALSTQPYLDFTTALKLEPDTTTEITLLESAACLNMQLLVLCNETIVQLFKRITHFPSNPSNPSELPTYEFVPVEQFTFQAGAQAVINYNDPLEPIDKISIEVGSCQNHMPMAAVDPNVSLDCGPVESNVLQGLENYLKRLANLEDLSSTQITYFPDRHSDYDGFFQGSELYSFSLNSTLKLQHLKLITPDNQLHWIVFDNKGYSCRFELSPFDPAIAINFQIIVDFQQIRVDAEQLSLGENHTFIIEAVRPDGTIATLRGRSCHNLQACQTTLPLVDCGLTCTITEEGKQLETFLNVLVQRNELTTPMVNLYVAGQPSIYNGVFQQTVLYDRDLSRIKGIAKQMISHSGGEISFYIFDLSGFYCKIQLKPIDSSLFIDWDEVVIFNGLTADLSDYSEGERVIFRINAILLDGMVIPLEGQSCYTIARCTYDKCYSLLYEVCMLNYEQATFNATLPPTNTTEVENLSMIQAFNTSIQPIFRPNTYYAIRIKTRDRLFRETGQSTLANYSNTTVFGFRTAGFTTGHFHRYRDHLDNRVYRPEYQALLNEDREDEYRLANLLHYIDFRHSEPAADGEIKKSKPLFYENVMLKLFFRKNYVYQMFRNWQGDWDSNNNYGEVQSELEVHIKEPAPDPSQTQDLAVAASWVINSIPEVTQDITILNNIMTYGDPCTSVTEIQPQGVHAEFDLQHLKPLTRYTALFNAHFRNLPETGSPIPQFTKEKVHEYSFITSKYPDYSAQINSYKLLVDDGTNAILKQAVFKINKAFDPVTELAVATALITGTLAKSHPSQQQFIHPFDRLIDGILALKDTPPPNSTEFNLIIDENTGHLLGILTKNEEPFQNPRLPEAILQNSLLLSVNGGSSADYKVLYSNDYAQAFITNADGSLNMPLGATYVFTFAYMQFTLNNPSSPQGTYEASVTETVSLQII